MKLPKIYQTAKYLNHKFLWGEGIIIKLDKDAQLIKAFPKIIDLVNDNRNKSLFSNVDLHKLKIEVLEIGDGINLVGPGEESN